jgi:hypothetical protein
MECGECRRVLPLWANDRGLHEDTPQFDDFPRAARHTHFARGYNAEASATVAHEVSRVDWLGRDSFPSTLQV